MNDLFRPEVINSRMHSFLSGLRINVHTPGTRFIYWTLLILLAAICAAPFFIYLPRYADRAGVLSSNAPAVTLRAKGAGHVYLQPGVRVGTFVLAGDSLAQVVYPWRTLEAHGAPKVVDQLQAPADGVVVAITDPADSDHFRIEFQPSLRVPVAMFRTTNAESAVVAPGNTVEIIDRANNLDVGAKVTRITPSEGGSSYIVQANLGDTSKSNFHSRDRKVMVRFLIGRVRLSELLYSALTFQRVAE